MVTRAQIGAVRPFSKARAIVVGVSDYQDEGITDLNYAHRDAEAFAAVLNAQQAWPFSSEDIVLLTNAEATYERFLSELNKIEQTAGPKERLIIYFAGHGDVEAVSEKPTGYLLFHNASKTTYAVGGACSVNTLDEVLNRLVLEKDTQVVLFTDACRSGSLTGNLAGEEIGGQAVTAANIAKLFTGVIKVLSCQPSQYSLEDPDIANGAGRGIFSYYLEKGFRGEANRNQDQYLTLRELERYLEDSVELVTNYQQSPLINGGNNFFQVNKYLSEEIPEHNEPAATPSVANQDSLLLKVVAFYEAIGKKELLYPFGKSAYDIYRSLGTSPAAQSTKDRLKPTLTTALITDPQTALNDYIGSPGKELAKRWANKEVYDRYPEYLATAAELMGEDSPFYNRTNSRGHYFRGINLRLEAKQLTRGAKKDSLYQAAMREQERALALIPAAEAPHIYNEMGILHQHFNQLKEAVKAYEKAYELSPRWGLTLNNLAWTYRLLGEFEQSEQFYLEAITVDNTLSISYSNLGFLYETSMKDLPRAIEAYETSLRLPDPAPQSMYNLASIYTYDEPYVDLIKAEPLIVKYLNIYPTNYYGRMIYGDILLNTNRLGKASAIAQELLEEQPKNTYALVYAASVEKKRGNLAIGVSHLRNALELEPDKADALLDLAGLYLLDRQDKKALATLKELLALKDESYSREFILNHEYFVEWKDNEDLNALLDKYFGKQ